MNRVFVAVLGVLCYAGLSVPADDWPQDVLPFVVEKNSSATVDGDLQSGKTLSNLRWAARSSVACFPATQNESFSGSHVFFRTDLPSYSVMKITAVPDANVDVNLYAYLVGGGGTKQVPPNVHSVLSCEASYNNGKPNPGQSQTVELNAIKNPYTVFIGVAGPKGVAAGRFRLEVDLVTRADEPEVAGDIEVGDLPLDAAGEAEGEGDLDEGHLMPVRWANSSQTACFPATQNDKFRGHHVFYRTQLPVNSKIEITAVPDSPDVDVNLYAFRLAATDFKTVPPSVNTGACESSFSYQGPNPGESETVAFYSGRNPYNVVIGVAGPKGVVSGGFTLKVKAEAR